MDREYELFTQDGHLTDEGLQALVENALDGELARLEAAEHLGFCDACLLRHTELLVGDHLMEPQRPLAGETLRRLRRRRARQAVGRYATVAAAACMALVMWGAGSLLAAQRGGDAAGLPNTPQTATQAPAIAEPQPSWGTRISQGLGNITSGFTSLFGGIGGGGAGTVEPDTATQPKRDDKVRQEHEQLFDSKTPPAGDGAKQPDPQQPDPDSAAE